MSDPDEIIIEAVAYFNGEFPDVLGETIIFKCLTITRKQFESVGLGLVEVDDE